MKREGVGTLRKEVCPKGVVFVKLILIFHGVAYAMPFFLLFR